MNSLRLAASFAAVLAALPHATPALAQTTHAIEVAHVEVQQWAWVDSNYRPHAYQACALTT